MSLSQWFLHLCCITNLLESLLKKTNKKADPKPSLRHCDLLGLDWEVRIFTFNKHLFWCSLTMGCSLRTRVLATGKSGGRFLKLLYNSRYGTRAWSWKLPAFPLHLPGWKTGAAFCNCALYSEVSYINSPYDYTQEPMCFCRVGFHFNHLLSSGSHYNSQDVLFSFLINLIVTQILYF